MAEKEYIEKAELLELIAERNRNTSNGNLSCLQMKRMIESLPAADVVEVVRCKDCKHFHAVEPGMFCDKYVSIHDASRSLQDFCSFAERKEPAHV